jgi:hypothetical protein
VSRKEPTLKDKLAAALRELLGIPYEHAKLMSAEQIISLVQFDHIHHHALNKHEPWVDEHWNLDPLLIGGHKIKTRTIDVPQIAKTKRISKEQEEFRNRLLIPRDERPPKKSRWGSRPFNRNRSKP